MENIGELYAALAKAQLEFEVAKKSSSVKIRSGYNFKYSDLATCIAATRPALAANGLVVIQGIDGDALVTTLAHTSGASISFHHPMLKASKAQEVGSCITYWRRYAYCAVVGLVSELDLDLDDESNKLPQATGSDQAPVGHDPEREAQEFVDNVESVLDQIGEIDGEALKEIASALDAEAAKRENGISSWVFAQDRRTRVAVYKLAAAKLKSVVPS